MLRGIIAAFLVQALGCSVALAGGTCILHPQPFRLRSDTIRWSIKIKSGEQCIQGLRWSTIMIDKVSIVEPPKAGRLIVEGPSFRYFADSAGSSDYFKIEIAGTSLHVTGASALEVDVNRQ
ncbi:hypothetical protein AB8Z38_15730 [Bradyrhizobium sp. LLZ17]|uniref:Uncharacterized protein n=1 Tax=Bradyrhizobium sp. LLZ17 TaxID=3239388 RepID=A0AB39XS74_9BRAD